MINKYFKDEKIQQNDLFFMCSMIERVARKYIKEINMLLMFLVMKTFIILSV